MADGPKTGSKLGLLGPKRCQSCQIHQNCVFSVVIIGLFDPKTGSKLGLSGPKWGHNWVVIPCTLNGVISPKNMIYVVLLGRCAFGYLRFSVSALLGTGAFGYARL
jgi:hypothetical protein